jgi:hypothetical protein
MDEMDKEDPKDLNHGQINNQHPNQQHIIVSGSHQQIPHQQVVIAQPPQPNVYHQQRESPASYAIYQPAQGQGQQPQRIIVQQVRKI